MGVSLSRYSLARKWTAASLLGVCATVAVGLGAVGALIRKNNLKDKARKKKEAEVDSDAAQQKLQDKVLSRVDKVLDEWFVTDLHRAGAKKFIKSRIANVEDTQCQRVRKWLMLRINGKVWDHGKPLMCKSAENVPDLRGLHVWPRADTPWAEKIEAHYDDILNELMSVRASKTGSSPSGFQPYRDPIDKGSESRKAADGLGAEGTDAGSWNVLYLILNHKRFEDNCAKFPITVKAIEDVFPRHYSHAFFSALTPGSHIVKHCGPSNRMLRVWLPLCGLEGFRLRVGDTIVRPNAGEAFAWDHSFEHEAWHDGPETRVVLIVDVWHPDLTEPEVKFLGTLQNCRLRAGRAMAEQLESLNPEDATYFQIVEKARSLLTDDDWWVVKAERDPTTRPT